MKKDVKKNQRKEWREDVEPTVQHSAVYLPMWLIGILGFLLYWGCNYVDNRGGNFSPLVYEPYVNTNQLVRFKPGGGDEFMTIGLQQYRLLCVACHQENGMGQGTQFPPLAGSEWVLAEGPNRLVRLVHAGLTGPITVSGQQFNAAMPPMGAGLDDKQLAAVLTYIRNAWGNSASRVTPEQVRRVREEMGARTAPFTAEELLRIPEGP
jgi:mono/diheme cytochrome c family protein